MTKTIDFIVADAAKAKGQDLRAALLAALVVGLSIALALGLRPDVEDIDRFYVLQSALLGVILFGFVWLVCSARLGPSHRAVIWKVAVVLGLVLSLFHEGLHPFSVQSSLVRFWRDTGACFAKGVFTGLVSGTVLTFAAFRLLPMPDRRWHVALAAAASFSGLVMLNLHCPSTVASHIVFGHWAQGILVTAIVAKWQNVIFRLKLDEVVGSTGSHSGALDALED